jgi:glycosyltransferase involved in cell wall biosynthesis
MKSILVLQNEIMEYRKPVYNGLAEHYEVVVLHSGQPSVTGSDFYREVITPEVQVGPFHLQPRSPLSKIIGNFDVVIAMFDIGWLPYLAPLYWKNRPKYILWGHRYSKNRLACIVRDRLMDKADRMLMYGDEEVDHMIERGNDPAKIAIAWNTMHVPNHHDYSNATKNSFLFVGRLQPLKRVDWIIEAFAHLQGRIQDEIILDVVGNAADVSPGTETKLKQLAKSLGIANKVMFHGRIDNPEILAGIFSRAYAYVSPSPVGLGVLHSLAYGVPIITLRGVRHGPEFHNLEHGVNAIICDDMREIEKTMKTVCTDRVFCAQLGHNAYQHYTQKRALSRMLDGFRRAIDE